MVVFRTLPWILSIGLLGSLYGRASAQTGPPPPPTNPALPTLFLVGNAASAMAANLPALFDPAKINVVDRSAVSSGLRITLDSGAWAATLALIRPGDFVLIQFARAPDASTDTDSLPGVNDDARVTSVPSAVPGEDLVRTYGWYLRRYAVETIARGATPILCAPLLADLTEQNKEGEWTMAIAVQQRLPFVNAAAAAGVTSASGTTRNQPALAVVAGLQGLPNDPLSGYFSAAGEAVPPYKQPPPSPAATPTAPPS